MAQNISKTFFQGREMEYSLMAKSLTWSQLNRACFSVTEARETHKQSATKGSYSKGMAE